MGVKKKLYKIGGCSGGVIIPKAIIDLLELKAGDYVTIDVDVKNGEKAIVIRPARREVSGR